MIERQADDWAWRFEHIHTVRKCLLNKNVRVKYYASVDYLVQPGNTFYDNVFNDSWGSNLFSEQDIKTEDIPF